MEPSVSDFCGYLTFLYTPDNKCLLTGDVDKGHIYAAINQFAQNTCIRFVPRTKQTDYISLDNQKTGCWSYIGRNGGQQILNLQSRGCLSDDGSAAHEMMHALGFFHEHIRPDRDDYIIINETNINPKQVAANFNKQLPSSVLLFGLPYEYGSVMHYGSDAFTKNGLPTIIPLVRLSD